MKDFEHSEPQIEDEIEVIDLDTQESGNKILPGRKLASLFRAVSLSALFRSRLVTFAVLVGLIILVLMVGVNIPSITGQTAPVSTPAASSSQSSIVDVAAVNGIAYIDAPDGTLSARRANDGKILWQHTFVTPTYHLAVATSTALYGISYNPAGAFVEALRASDGSVLWNAPVPPPGPRALMVNNGVVYFNALDGTVYALRASDGNELWYFSSGMFAPPLDSFLYVSAGIACIHAKDGTVHVVRGDDGTEILRYRAEDGTSWQPFVENNIIYSSNERGVVQANRASDGEFVWRTSSKVNGLWFWSEAEGMVYLYNADNVKALRGTNGSLLWQYKTDSDLAMAILPSAQQEITYLVTQDNTAVALQASNGSLLWQHKVPSNLLYGPAARDGILYLGTDDYSVDAWRGRDDLYLWRYTTSSAILWYPLIDDGIMYLRQVNGALDVVRMSDGVLLWRYSTR
jgi:outer membrane protein assembly factor BamB